MFITNGPPLAIDSPIGLPDINKNFDLIIDDGSHHIVHQQISLGFLFPFLKQKGIFIVEDIHTSFNNDSMTYWGFDSDYKYSTYNVLKRVENGDLITSEHMSQSEIAYLNTHINTVNIFDMKKNKKHITCIIEKK